MSLPLHLVVVMLENRGFDSVLGFLYSGSDTARHNLPALKPGETAFDGLAGADRAALANSAVVHGKTITQEPVPVVRASNSPGWDPGEEYHHVNVQLFGSKDPPRHKTAPGMKGFLSDYSTVSSGDTAAIRQVMHCYTPVDLPVLSALAKGYAVSDRWFASVPTQTNANRAFSICGTSLGLVDNGFLSTGTINTVFKDDQFCADTVWNVLSANGFDDWAIFWSDIYPTGTGRPYTRNSFPHLDEGPRIKNIDRHFRKMDEFFQRAEDGSLPAFSYLEPSWGGAVLGGWLSILGTEYHPPSDTTSGEFWLRRIYSSLLNSKSKTAWANTILVILFDEHGGTYDHVPPPWGAVPPWGTATDPPLPKGRQYGFGFDRFGVRVPAIVVSPKIEAGTVFRSPTDTPFDHTSMIATVLKLLLPDLRRSEWGLGERVANAPTFDFLTTRATPRTDDVLAPRPSPAVGQPIAYGDRFYLRNQNGETVGKAVSRSQVGIPYPYYYPVLSKHDAVPLEFRLGWGPVDNGGTVQIRTGEDLEPEVATEPLFAGIRNTLYGAETGDSYWWSTDDAKDYGEQKWRVERVGGAGGGPLRYGDKVYIENLYAPRLNQHLCSTLSSYLEISSLWKESWTIEPVT